MLTYGGTVLLTSKLTNTCTYDLPLNNQPQSEISLYVLHLHVHARLVNVHGYTQGSILYLQWLYEVYTPLLYGTKL